MNDYAVKDEDVVLYLLEERRGGEIRDGPRGYAGGRLAG